MFMYVSMSVYIVCVLLSSRIKRKRALERLFVKCAFLVLFNSLFHTTIDDAIIQIIAATIHALQVIV